MGQAGSLVALTRIDNAKGQAMGRVPPWLPGSAGGAGEIRNSVDLTQQTKGGQPRPLRHLPEAEVAVPKQMFREILSLIAIPQGRLQETPSA